MPDGWVIEIMEDGSCDIYQDRYIYQYDLPTIEDAKKEIAAFVSVDELRKGVPVTVMEPSGVTFEDLV